MTTSGTYAFNPSLGEITLYSYMLAGVKPTAITQEHMFSSRMATNLMFVDWANKGVNLWKVELKQTTLVQGTPTYNVDATSIMVLDAYISTVQNGVATDRPILPISRSEYSTYPNKSQQGFPTVFWFDRLVAPTITLFPVPDGTQTYLKYYQVVQLQDANYTGAQTMDLQFRYLNAMADGLAYQLSRIWNQAASAGLKLQANESYSTAALQDIEQTNIYYTPMIGGYFRP